jgi:hypothetical protein
MPVMTKSLALNNGRHNDYNEYTESTHHSNANH